MLVLYDWVHRGIFPLVGPTTLSGQHLGPFFYYLIFPGYLLFGGPIGVSIWSAMLGVVGVYFLYRSVEMIYGRFSALMVSLLYAVSPALVIADRIIWEPNLVPLFSILFVYFSIKQHDRISFWIVVIQGALCGILIQLHYPNVFFIALLGLVALGHSVRIKRWKYLRTATLGWVVGFVIVMAPFLYYEYTHGFSDIRGTVDIVAKTSSGVGKRQTLFQAWEYAGRVIGKVLPNVHTPTVVLFLAGWLVFLIGNFTSWNIFWTVWFVFGVIAIGKYSGVVFDHYLNFIIPVPFLMIASVIQKISNKYFVFCLMFIICTVQVLKTDIHQPGNNDVVRVSTAVQHMIEIAGSTPFSFALFKSKSFSDLHYQYYFRVKGKDAAPLASQSYPLLFLVCDEIDCPSAAWLTSQTRIPVICYRSYCNDFYPSIMLFSQWSFVSEKSILHNNQALGMIYVFRRK